MLDNNNRDLVRIGSHPRRHRPVHCCLSLKGHRCTFPVCFLPFVRTPLLVKWQQLRFGKIVQEPSADACYCHPADFKSLMGAPAVTSLIFGIIIYAGLRLVSVYDADITKKKADERPCYCSRGPSSSSFVRQTSALSLFANATPVLLSDLFRSYQLPHLVVGQCLAIWTDSRLLHCLDGFRRCARWQPGWPQGRWAGEPTGICQMYR